jgi:multimeric flavodoxin WrbA
LPSTRRKKPRVRKGQPDVGLTRDEFARRFVLEFSDPRFAAAATHVRALADIAWRNYEDGRKAPRTVRAGPRFADPDYDLSVDWLAAHRAVQQAQRLHDRRAGPARVLIVNASPRNDHTCPGEMSKTWRLARIARDVLDGTRGIETELLDLSRLTAEYGRVIYPCKACVSTAMPLCHWPCSCYPNHGQGQLRDWMHEIYPMWVAAHGILIVTPVHWYQAPSVLKLMMDRLVCADGGNPDPTSTSGKDAAKAKEIELRGWPYPRHIAGRVFALIVHADAAGAEGLRRMLHDWLTDMHLVSAGADAMLDRYIGYYEPYAMSHDALDRDPALRQEVSNVAAGLARAVKEARRGRHRKPPARPAPRPK